MVIVNSALPQRDPNSNFGIFIRTSDGRTYHLDVPWADIEIRQRGTSDRTEVNLIVRPDLWTESRARLLSQNNVQLSKTLILEANPIEDPNHWLTRSNEDLGKYFKSVALSYSKKRQKRRQKKYVRR